MQSPLLPTVYRNGAFCLGDVSLLLPRKSKLSLLSLQGGQRSVPCPAFELQFHQPLCSQSLHSRCLSCKPTGHCPILHGYFLYTQPLKVKEKVMVLKREWQGHVHCLSCSRATEPLSESPLWAWASRLENSAFHSLLHLLLHLAVSPQLIQAVEPSPH